MSVQRRWEIQQAIYSRLTAELAGQGPGGANVTVYDHAPADPPRVHVRIDGFNVVQRPIKSDKTLLAFNVHIFDRPTTQSTSARGQKTAAELQEKVVAALHNWLPIDPSASPSAPVLGASAIRHSDSSSAPDDDGLTQHAISRFSVYIAQS